MVKSCVYASCKKNTKNSPGLNFIPFVKPSVFPERAQKWLEIVGRTDLSLKDIKNTTYICQKHFLPDLYDYNWYRNHLLEPLPVEDDDYKEKQIEYLNYLVKVLDANTILDCVIEKLSTNFSPNDIKLRMTHNLALSGLYSKTFQSVNFA